jgi:hypothetical protein
MSINHLLIFIFLLRIYYFRIFRLPHLSLYVKEPCSTSCNNDTEQPDQNPTDSVNNNILNLTGFSNLSLLSQNSDEDTRVNNELLFKYIFIFF